MLPFKFFAVDVEEKEPEVRSLDIYIGEKEPDVPDGVEVKVFKGKTSLRSFLMKGEWDIATVYKSPECPKEIVEELTDWMDLHMSLGKVITFDKDKGEKDDSGS
jgi:hypothetical protein